MSPEAIDLRKELESLQYGWHVESKDDETRCAKCNAPLKTVFGCPECPTMVVCKCSPKTGWLEAIPFHYVVIAIIAAVTSMLLVLHAAGLDR